MLAQEALQRALVARFEELKRKNPAYSLRAYSSRLGLSPGALSTILRGQRRISLKMAERILSRLDLDPAQLEEVRLLLKSSMHSKPLDEARYLQLRDDQFQLIGEGLHFDLLSLMETQDFVSSSEWMAKRLGSSSKQVERALERLERLELVKRTARGRWVPTGSEIKTTDNVASLAIKRYHEDRFEEAKDKLHAVGVEQRDFNAVTIAVDRDKVPAAKQLIREFKEKIKTLMQAGSKNEVYRICIQLYPVTEISETAKTKTEKK